MNYLPMYCNNKYRISKKMSWRQVEKDFFFHCLLNFCQHINTTLNGRRHITWILLPDTVENVAVGKDTNVNIGHKYVMESTFFFVSKECIRHPYLFGVCHCEVLYLGWKRKETILLPILDIPSTYVFVSTYYLCSM